MLETCFKNWHNQQNLLYLAPPLLIIISQAPGALIRTNTVVKGAFSAVPSTVFLAQKCLEYDKTACENVCVILCMFQCLKKGKNKNMGLPNQNSHYQHVTPNRLDPPDGTSSPCSQYVHGIMVLVN